MCVLSPNGGWLGGGIHKIINAWAVSGRAINNFTMVLAGVLLPGCSSLGGRHTLQFIFVPQLLDERGTQRHTEEVAWEKGHRLWPELFYWL